MHTIRSQSKNVRCPGAGVRSFSPLCFCYVRLDATVCVEIAASRFAAEMGGPFR